MDAIDGSQPSGETVFTDDDLNAMFGDLVPADDPTDLTRPTSELPTPPAEATRAPAVESAAVSAPEPKPGTPRRKDAFPRLRRAVAQSRTKLQQSIDTDPPSRSDSRKHEKWAKWLQDCSGQARDLETVIGKIGELRDPRCLQVLAPLVASKHKLVRRAAAQALAGLDIPAAQVGLLTLLTDPKKEVAREAMRGLVGEADQHNLKPLLAYGSLGVDESISLCQEFRAQAPPVRDALFAEARGRVRDEALLALKIGSEMCDEQSVELMAPFTRHPDPAFRAIAIEGLVRTNNRQVVRFLNKALEDPDEEVRARAAGALNRFSSPGSVKRLLPLIRDNSPRVRRNALLVLRDQSLKEHAALLIDALQVETDEVAVQRLLEAVGNTKDSRAPAAVLPFTSHSDAEVRIAALAALVRMKDEKSLNDLSRLLADPEVRIRRKAVEGLGRSGNAKAVDRLMDAVRTDPDVQVRAISARALGRFPKSQRIIDVLHDAMQDEAQVRCQSILAMQEIGGPTVVPVLADRLRDSAAEVRNLAATALGNLRVRDQIGPLRELLDDPDDMVGRSARKALAQLGDSGVDAYRRRKGLSRFANRMAATAREWSLPVGGGLLSLVVILSLIWLLAPQWLGLSSEPPLIVARLNQVSLSPDGTRVALVRDRGVVDLWDADGRLVTRFAAPETPRCIHFSADSSSLTLLGGKQWQWDLSPDSAPIRKSDLSNPMQVLATNATRSVTLAVARTGDALVWDSDHVSRPLKLKAQGNIVAVSPDGSLVAVSSGDRVQMLKTSDGSKLAEFPPRFSRPGRAGISCMAFGPDSTLLAIGTTQGDIGILNLRTGSTSEIVSKTGRVSEIVWTNEQVIACHAAQLVFIDTGTAEVSTMQVPVRSPNLMSVSADGRRIVLASAESRDAVLIDAVSREVLRTLAADES